MLSALTACAPFGPNATGRWTGTCTGASGFDVVLELAEEAGAGGDLEGEIVVIERNPEESEDVARVDGYRDGRDVTLGWDRRATGAVEATLKLRGDELTGAAVLSERQYRETCALELDR